MLDLTPKIPFVDFEPESCTFVSKLALLDVATFGVK